MSLSHPDLLSFRILLSGLLMSSSSFPASGGAGAWGLRTALGARPNTICLANNSILLFPYLPVILCQPPSFFLPAALSLPLLAHGLGGSRNPKRMRPRAAATSSQPAEQRLRAFRGGVGRCGEAGPARERRGRGPMGPADGGGGGVVRAEGRGQEAVAGEPGRPRRQSLLRLSHSRGSRVGAPLASNPADHPTGSWELLTLPAVRHSPCGLCLQHHVR